MQRLQDIMLDGKTSLKTWILQTYLRKSDYEPSFRCLDKMHYQRYAEKCPRCHEIMDPKEKRAFQQGMKKMIVTTLPPPSPCQGPRCKHKNQQFWGYMRVASKTPRYRFRMFHKTHNEKREVLYKNFLQDAIDDRYQIDMFKYRNRHSGWC